MSNFATTPQHVTVLIPAAGRVPEGLLALSNVECPAMIPIGGRPIIYWTLSYLRDLGYRTFVVAVARRHLFVEEFVQCVFGDSIEITFVVPTPNEGLGQTVLTLAQHCTTPGALLVLGDTHFSFVDPNSLFREPTPLVLTQRVEESYRWCIVESDGSGQLRTLYDKEPKVEASEDALIGVYYFPSAAALLAAAQANVLAARAQHARPEVSGVLLRLAAQQPIRVARAQTWLDCGNPDMQAQAHQAMLQSRSFNEIRIDPTLGTLTKRSSHSKKFIDEINYLRLLPPELNSLFPRLVQYDTAWAAPWLTLEYYGYPNLSEVFLFEHVDAGVWARVFAHLHELITKHFGAHSRPIAAEAVHDMYLGKTQRRLATMNCSPALRLIVDAPGDIRINGQRQPGLNALWPRVEAAVTKLAASPHGAIIHGDLCFSNILYDLRSRICKLIDPRGSFGDAGIYGDQRYDVAKLWHSVHGHYDFIVNDLFHVALDGTHTELHIRANPSHRAIEAKFVEQFFAGPDPHFSHAEIQLITALLFLSMPALHDEAPLRQAAMFLRGVQLLNAYFEDYHADLY